MGKIKNTIVTILVCVTMGLSPLTLSACDNGKQETPTVPNVSGPTTPEPDVPTPPYEEPTWTEQPYNDAVANIAGLRNYTYSLESDAGSTTWEIDGDKARYFANGDNRGVYMYVDEDGKSYQLEWQMDQLYHKTDIDDFDSDALILDDLLDAVLITDYDEASDSYSATMSGKSYTLTIDGNDLTFEGDDEIINVWNVGSTNVPMPSANRIVDDTHKEDVEPNPPVNPDDGKDDDKHENENKLFTENNGVRTYNSKLLGETIKEILLSEYSAGKTVLEKFTDKGAVIEEILYVSSNSGDIKIATLDEWGDDQKSIKVIDIFTIPESVASGFSDNKQSWVDGLSGTKSRCIDHTLETILYEESINNQAELKQIAEKCFEKIATVGVQTSSCEKEGTPNKRYENAEVLRVFARWNIAEGVAGYDLGNTHRKGLLVIANDANGDPLCVTMDVATSSWNSFEDSILKPDAKKDKFIVYAMGTETEIDKDFFADKSKENTNNVANNTAKQVALPVGREREE